MQTYRVRTNPRKYLTDGDAREYLLRVMACRFLNLCHFNRIVDHDLKRSHFETHDLL